MKPHFITSLFCFTVFLLTAQGAQLTTIPVNESGLIQDISASIFIMEDQDCRFDSNSIQRQIFQQKFTKAPKLPNFGYTNSCYWAAFSLEGKANQKPLYLWMDGTTVLQDVQLYMEQADGTFQVFTYNHLQPVSRRSIPMGTTPVFKLPAFNGQRRFYLRQQTDYYMTFSIKVMDEVGYLRQIGQFQRIGTFFLTLFLVVSLLLFLVALLMKTAVIAWMSIHIFAVALGIFIHYGFGVEWLWKDAMVLNYHLGVFSMHVISLTILLYLKPFLLLNNWWQRFYKLLIGISILLALFSCWLPHNHIILKTLENFISIALLGVLLFPFPKMLREKPQLIWIFLGCSSLYITYSLGDCWYRGIGFIGEFGDYWVLAGQTIEILFLSIGAILVIRQMQLDQQKSAYLQELDATKSRFFTNISHELKTPLTLILTPLEKALSQANRSALKEDLALAFSNSKKLLRLVNEILDLSRLENNKLILQKKEIALHPLINRLFFAFESLASIKNIHLKLDYQLAKEVWVNMDIGKFEKIIDNLISNAIKFSDNNGMVTLTISNKTAKLFLLTVHNTGKGIPAAELPYIFNRYYQGKLSKSTNQKGTGIGLALAKELAHLFNGQLSVDSSLNKGTTFYLELPLEIIPPKAEKAEIAKITTTKPQRLILESPIQNLVEQRPKILLVEDHQEISRFLVKTLTEQYHCTVARDGIEALQKIEQVPFDLIITDIMMPKMDGFTLLKTIHEREIFCHTPVIILSARYLEADKLKGFQLGVDDYITKPFSIKELVARIENLLNNKKERTVWQTQNNNSTITQDTLIPSTEQELLNKAKALVTKNLTNTNYKVGNLAKDMHYSQRQLERIIKKLTGLSPVNFIKEIRLQKARTLLESRQFSTITAVSFEVGFADSNYFSKVYLKRFGKRPSEV